MLHTARLNKVSNHIYHKNFINMRFLNKIAVEENMTLLTMHKTDSSQINAHVKIRLIIITHNLSFFLLLLLNVLK